MDICDISMKELSDKLVEHIPSFIQYDQVGISPLYLKLLVHPFIPLQQWLSVESHLPLSTSYPITTLVKIYLNINLIELSKCPWNKPKKKKLLIMEVSSVMGVGICSYPKIIQVIRLPLWIHGHCEGTAHPRVIIPQSYFLRRYGWIHRLHGWP